MTFSLKKLSKVAFCLLLFTSLMFCYSSPALAEIIINEFFPYPDSTQNNDGEWIELINTDFHTNVSFIPPDLDGWTIWDTTSSPSLLYAFPTEKNFLSQFLTIEVNNKLNNSGDGVVLKNNFGNIVDQVSYSTSQIGMSWARNEAGIFELTSPSKNSLNIFPTITPTPSPLPTPTLSSRNNNSIRLSEIMACPSEGSEWIELYNSSFRTHELLGWEIEDSQGKIYSFSDESIAPDAFLSIEIVQKLNNSGDQVILKDSEKNSIDSMDFNTCTKGSSFIWYENQWQETLQPSRGEKNVLVSHEISPSPSITPTTSPVLENSAIELSPENQRLSQKTTSPISNQSFSTPITQPNSLADLNADEENRATFLSGPPFSDHLLFNTTITKKNRLISVIIGGLILVAVGIFTFYDSQKNDHTETENF